MRENSWLQYKNGAIDENVWAAYMRGFVNVIERDPYANAHWEASEFLLDPEFVEIAREWIESGSD
jgi:hypothetical protein